MNWIIYFFILLPSCIGIKNQNSVEIDLSKTVPSIKYSTFVKNIEYVDLHLNDSLPIYGVENLYLDENKIFIKDRKSEGILIFDAITGKLLKRITQYKEGRKRRQMEKKRILIRKKSFKNLWIK